MSFGSFARKTRDPALPFAHRAAALRSCVQLYRPYGFHATLSYLEELAGPHRRDERALLRALDIVVASRERWHAEVRAYAASRREAKQRGQRSPGPGEANPSNAPLVWYGARQAAALHALRYWRRARLPALLETPDQTAVDVAGCVEAALSPGGGLTPQQRTLLADGTAELRRRIGTGLWHGDQLGYFRCQDLLRVAWLVEQATAADDR